LSVYKEIEALIGTDPDEAARQATQLLEKNPDDPLALFILASVYAKAERFGLAFNLFQRVADLRPDRAEAWNNVGMALQGLHQSDRAREAFLKAGKIDRKCPNYPANVALTFMEQRDYGKAIEWCQKAFSLDPEHAGAKTTYGMSSLALGDWANGWKAYGYALGGKFRKEVVYGDEVRWDGSPGKTLVVYGEQGIGDEVMYASCLPDAVAISKEVVVECDPRLEGLFKRSFPSAFVYGTRRQQEIEWPNDHKLEARCPIGQLPQFFRPSPESCPGTPYLVADPERRLQWRALFDSWGKKPKIGLAWSGGSRHNHPESRDVGLEGFRELIESVDADWVSLQYKDPRDEIEESGLPVKHYPRATLTADYDDTAGLVAELDLVIGPHTSVHHLAGALGVPSLILVPTKTNWTYARDTLNWYRGATLVRQVGAWKATIETLLSSPAIRGLR
jgi:tetratricopeptide (TPR) repeat protein